MFYGTQRSRQFDYAVVFRTSSVVPIVAVGVGRTADVPGCRPYRGVSGAKTAPRTGLVNSLARQSM